MKNLYCSKETEVSRMCLTFKEIALPVVEGGLLLKRVAN